MMKRGQRILSLILALMLCVSMLPVSALALELPELDVLESTVEAVGKEEISETENTVVLEEASEFNDEYSEEAENAIKEMSAEELEAAEEISEIISAEEPIVVEKSDEAEQLLGSFGDWTNYGTECYLTVSGASHLYIEPFAASTKIETLDPDKSYIAKCRRFAKNSYGNWWAGVYIYADGAWTYWGYVNCSYTTYRQADGDYLDSILETDATFYTYFTQDSDPLLSGTIYTDYGGISIHEVKAWITTGDDYTKGTVKQSKTMSVGAQSFDLSKLNSSLAFDNLVPGVYTLAIGSSLRFYYSDDGTTSSKYKIEPAYSFDLYNDCCNVYYWTFIVVEAKDYMTLCKSWPTHMTVTVKTSAAIRTLPCANSTHSASETIRNSVVGEKLTVTGLYKNSFDNYFYQVDLDGTVGYHYAGDTINGEAIPDGIKINNVREPSSLTEGDKFTIRGNINSDYSQIVAVEAYVADASGNTVLSSKDTGLTTFSYSLEGSKVDNNLKFGNLSAGTYEYSIWVKYRTYYFDGGDHEYVDYYHELHTNQFVVSEGEADTYTIKYDANGGTGAPAAQTKTPGTKLVLSTTVPTREGYLFLGWGTSSNATKPTYQAGGNYTQDASATLYAVWSDAENFLDTCTFYPAHMTVKITAVDEIETEPWDAGADLGVTGNVGDVYTATGVYVNPYGSCWYRIDVNGKVGYYWYKRADVVEHDTSKVVISDGVYPGTLYVGDDFTVTGTIQSTYVPIVEVEAVVIDASGDVVLSSKVSGQNAYSFDIGSSTLNSLDFGSLKAGNYTYAIKSVTRHYYVTSTDIPYSDQTKTLVSKSFTVKERETYTITFDANGGSGAPASQMKTHNITMTLSSTVPTRDGYTFLGWATSKTATGAEYKAGGSYTGNANVTLYAVWEAIPAADAPKILVSNVSAAAGGTAEVTVSLENNPGIASFELEVIYDETKLKWTDITHSDLGGEWSTAVGENVLWVNVEDYTEDGVILTLIFEVLKDTSGEASVSVAYNNGDIFNVDEKDINFEVVAGSIAIKSHVPGDVNNDGVVNNKDLLRLMKYLKGKGVEVNKAALDINGDGVANNKDLLRLMRHLAGKGVEIY